jgi:flotillin
MNGKDGMSSTANFLSGLMKSIPPLNELFDMAGMELPEYLGKDKKEITDGTQQQETVEDK